MNTSINYTPKSENTITEWCNAGKKLYIANHAFGMKNRIGDIVFTEQSYLFKYYRLLTKNMQELTLTDDEFVKYRYQPKLFCQDRYGTPELWALLLFVNNMTSVVQFNRKNISVFSSSIINLLPELLNLHGKDIEDNRLTVEE